LEFDDIISGKEAFLHEAILLETQEGLRLDFKAISMPDSFPAALQRVSISLTTQPSRVALPQEIGECTRID
jgi:hypothetical protein